MIDLRPESGFNRKAFVEEVSLLLIKLADICGEVSDGKNVTIVGAANEAERDTYRRSAAILEHMSIMARRNG